MGVISICTWDVLLREVTRTAGEGAEEEHRGPRTAVSHLDKTSFLLLMELGDSAVRNGASRGGEEISRFQEVRPPRLQQGASPGDKAEAAGPCTALPQDPAQRSVSTPA